MSKSEILGHVWDFAFDGGPNDQGNDAQSLISTLREESFVWIGTPDGTETAVSGAVTPIDNPVPVPAALGGITTLELLVDESRDG